MLYWQQVRTCRILTIRGRKHIHIQKKQDCCDLQIAAAFVKGRSLVAVQPTESFFPLMHYCWSGSDGRDSLGPVPDDGIETLPPVSRYQIQTEPVLNEVLLLR